MGSGRIWHKLYPARAGKRADGYQRHNNSGGTGNINHRPDRLRADRVGNGASLSGLGIAESWRRESHGRSGNHQLRPELRQAIRAAVRGSNAGHSSSGATGAADGSPSAGAADAAAVARHTTTAHTGVQERQSEAGLSALSALRNITGCGGEHDAAWTFACPYSPVRHGYHRH